MAGSVNRGSRMAFLTEYLSGPGLDDGAGGGLRVSRQTATTGCPAYEREGPGRLAGGLAPAAPDAAGHAAGGGREVLRARDRHPHWGAGKLRAWLQRQAPDRAWPCRDTIHQVLARAGQVRQRRRRRGVLAPPAASAGADGAQYGLDRGFQRGVSHAGWPAVLSVHLARRLQSVCAAVYRRCRRCAASTPPPQLARAFAAYGLPERIRSDNGPPFGSPGSLARLSRVAVWWLRLGVWPERITPRPAGAKRRARAVSSRAEARDGAAPRRQPARATTAVCSVRRGVPTTNGRTKPWPSGRPRRATRRRRGRCPGGVPALAYPGGLGGAAGARRAGRSSGAAVPVSQRTCWPVKTSRSSRSTTGCGWSALPRCRSRSFTNAAGCCGVPTIARRFRRSPAHEGPAPAARRTNC